MITTVSNTQITFSKDVRERYPNILTAEAMDFLSSLHERFNERRLQLLEDRIEQQQLFDQGALPNFLEETKEIRKSQWQAAETPRDLLDRRVEITGPVDRKMVINALNSGAKTFMADFEDSTAPTWDNVMQGQQNLLDANNRTIDFCDVSRGKEYSLNEKTAVLLVRPRGLHLNEKHLQCEGKELSGSLVDFGLYAFHNTKVLLDQNTAPYFYLPKLEHYKEAQWWNDVFEFTQEYLGVPIGTYKTTLLIETITASFQLHEFIYALKEHIVGLNCGRWDYIFSYIKCFKDDAAAVLPNRDLVNMEVPFMHNYSKLAVKTCHRRGVHAMGGMSAFIPVKNNEKLNESALEKVTKDKTREVVDGHDGSWVAHPGLIAPVKEVFDLHMPSANQIQKQLDQEILAEDLLGVPKGEITEEGVRKNLLIGLLYVEAWLRGRGAVALNNLMEDAATAEISRAQLWQWLKHKVSLSDGRILSKNLLETWFYEEQLKAREYLEDIFPNRLENAAILYRELIFSTSFKPFLTLEAYELL